MKINHHKEICRGYDYISPAALSEWDLDQIPNSVREIWYWYGTGSYEGSGELIMQTEDGLFHHKSMGHCSCYGPTDSINLGAGRTLEELKSAFTEEAFATVKPLFDMMPA